MANTRATLERAGQGITGAVIVGLVSLLVIGVLWGVSRNAPSAGRDPNMTPLVLVPTRTPTAVATPPPSAIVW
jgi:hypothetical protein